MDRRTMANDGMIIIVAQISSFDSSLLSPAKISTFGLTSGKGEKHLVKELEDLVAHYLDNAKESIMGNNKLLEDELRKVVRKHCLRKYRKYPMIVPTLFIQ
jgi:ribonuclease J